MRSEGAGDEPTGDRRARLSSGGPRVVNIVQARLTSERFPGKTFAELSGSAVVDWIAERCRASSLTSEVVFAVPDTSSNDPLDEHLRNLGIAVVRGSEHDVLGRMLLAAEKYEPDVVVRTCADRPLIDPLVIDHSIAEFLADSAGGIRFSHRPEGDELWEFGFGVEVLAFSSLRDLERRARSQRHREHVTLLAYEDGVSSVVPVPVPDRLKDLMRGGRRFDVDTPEDLAHLESLVAGSPTDVSAEVILRRANAVAGSGRS